MAAVVLEDFIKPYRKTPFTPRAADILMKLTVVFLGIFCVALVFVVEKTGSHVLQVSFNFAGICIKIKLLFSLRKLSLQLLIIAYKTCI